MKRDGKWLVASVRDFPEEATEAMAPVQLQSLEWLVGHWGDESSEGRVERTCPWPEDGNYFLQDYVVKANPKSPDAKFLLGYHYQTCGHNANAAKQYKLAQTLLPDDKLIKQLIAMTTPPDASRVSGTPPAPPTVSPEKVLKAEQFVGTWKATSQGATFQLDLTHEGAFTWTYLRGKEKQSVTGVFAVDQNNLALETNDGGGTMLSEIDFANPSQFKFKMIGDGEKDPGLDFKKS